MSALFWMLHGTPVVRSFQPFADRVITVIELLSSNNCATKNFNGAVKLRKRNCYPEILPAWATHHPSTLPSPPASISQRG